MADVDRLTMQVAVLAKQKRAGPKALAVVFILWLSLVCTGMAALWLYSTAPGKDGEAPVRWPTPSRLQRRAGASTLLMFVHPKCPCSRASIGELAALLAHSGGRLCAKVIFLQPPGEADSWVHTDLWHAASQLPGTEIISDLDSRETKLFRAAVSGETLVYDVSGYLRFHGGITVARGHIGDNAGCSAIEYYANTGTIPLSRTPAFGCPLFSESTSRVP
ncbi:MAG TPA: hypothetical protein VFO40_09770 [Chthoniobacterales bacterium]|nr:hypothetical protein [Chthoniobacterales bacterium]